MSVRVGGREFRVDGSNDLIIFRTNISRIGETEGLDKLTNLWGLDLNENQITRIDGLGTLG